MRPLRQQVFERVRAAGLIPRVQVAKDLGVTPASVTTITSELIESGLIEEVAATRDGETVRGRPAVALGVRASAHRVVGMKISDREHTAVIVDFAGNLIADEAIPRRPGPMTVAGIADSGRGALGPGLRQGGDCAGRSVGHRHRCAGVCRQFRRHCAVVFCAERTFGSPCVTGGQADRPAGLGGQ